MISIELSQNELQSKQTSTEEKVIDLQWRGMRENLLFTGIDEPVLQRGEYENAEQTLRNFLRDEISIYEDIPLDRFQRIGRFRPSQQYPRTIIAKFERYRGKDCSHCSRIHPSVKLSTPKVYTCSLIVAVSWKISVSNY